MASDRQEATVSENVFLPFKAAWRLALGVLLLWFVHAVLQSVWVRSHRVDAAAHIESQLHYYIPQSDPTGLAATLAKGTTELIVRFKLAHLLIPARRENPDAERDMRVANAVQRGVWASFRPEITTSLYSTVLYAAKLGVVLSLLPLFALWLLAFAVDGFVQRYIRRACAGRESATIYHRAKLYGFKMLPPMAAVIFLCAPTPLHPAAVFLPAALFSAVLVRLQATYYKKYL